MMLEARLSRVLDVEIKFPPVFSILESDLRHSSLVSESVHLSSRCQAAQFQHFMQFDAF